LIYNLENKFEKEKNFLIEFGIWAEYTARPSRRHGPADSRVRTA
jgi:hypothetical protein